MYKTLKKLFLMTFIITAFWGCNRNPNICRIVNIKGNAYEIDDNKNVSRSLRLNSLIDTGVTIRTDRDSFVDIEFTDNSRIRIQEESIIKISKLYNGGKSDKTRIFIELGESFAKFSSALSGQNMEFETKTMVIRDNNAEFIVSVTNDNITKIAVINGKLEYSAKIDTKELDLIRKKDPGTASKIEGILSENKTLSANEEFELTMEAHENYKKDINKIINKINSELENNKDNEDKNSVILSEYIKELDKFTNDFKESKKVKITDDELKKLLESIEGGKKSLDNTNDLIKEIPNRDSSDNTDEKKILKEDNKKDIEIKVTENDYIWKIKKISANENISLAEKNTAVSCDMKRLYLSSNSNNSVYCINPATGEIEWRFTDSELKNIYSQITASGANLILGTPDMIFILNQEGVKVSQYPIERGVTYWAKPVKSDNKLFIPASSGIYIFDGKDINPSDKLSDISGQVYMTSDSTNLYFITINDPVIKMFNIKENKIIWTSERISNPIFMPPTVNKGNIYIADNIGYLYKFAFQNNENSPKILKLDAGVVVNLLIMGNMLYLLDNKGDFYSVDLTLFKEAKKIMKVENNPDINKFLTKSFAVLNDEIFYCSDSGKLLIYNGKTGTGVLEEVIDNPMNNPLIGSPAVFGNIILFVDTKFNVYKRYKDIK